MTDQPVVLREARLHHRIGVGFAGVLVVLGVYFTVTAFGFGIVAEGNPIGPGAVPAVLGVLLVVGAVLIAAGDMRALRRLRESEDGTGTRDGVPAENAGTSLGEGDQDEADAEAKPEAPGARGEGHNLVRALLVLAFLGIGLALVPVIGMVLGLTLAVMAIAAVVERLSPLRVALVGIITALLLWLVFGLLLSVNFPNSLIGL